MAQELIYTSAPRGLLPGSRGFCTVARTVGLSPVLGGLLESRSGYRHLFPPQSDKAALNPVNWVHGIIRLGQTPTHILSRIGDAGLDYTKRSNLIAHHLILGPDELKACGPAAILAQSDWMQTRWDQPPTELAKERRISGSAPDSLRCVHWEQATGDAGWGGVLAESVLQARPACLLYEPGTDLLPLFKESIALLPELLRWKITFSTYVREVPATGTAGGTFLWKGMLAGTPEAEQIRANKGILLIDLTTTEQQSKPKNESVFVKAARTGVVAPPPMKSKPQSPPEPPPIFEEVNAGSIPPPVSGETYTINIDESSTKRKRKRNIGTWSSRYESQAVSAEKERKAQRIFFTILGFSSLAILVLLTLLGDEFFHSGGMRKGVLQSFGIGRKAPDAKPQGPFPDEPPGDDLSRHHTENAAENVDHQNVVESPTEEELEARRRQEEEWAEAQRLLEEAEAEAERLLEEERLAEWQRLQKEAEEEHERRKTEMQTAFLAIPAAFPLLEPQRKAFGGVELPKNSQKEFAPLFPYKDYLQIQWISLLAPKGWRYNLEKVPQVFLDDPYAQWNLIAHCTEGTAEPAQRSLNLASLRLGEDGLELEWRPQTAGLESNFEIVNKLPFSYLRLTFGPNAATEPGPGREGRPLPIPKRFDPTGEITEEIAETDFTRNVWFRDVSLWTPFRNQPFALSDRGTTITRPTNPVERFDGVFGRDRFRVGLENLDLQRSLSLEVTVRPETAKNIAATCEATDVPWKRTISFNVEPDSEKGLSLTIPMSAEVLPDRIEFRDTSREMEAEANRQRTTLQRTIRERTDPLNEWETDDAEHKLAQARELFLAIPVARKSVLTAGFSIHYSVYLQGREGTGKMLILTTAEP